MILSVSLYCLVMFSLILHGTRSIELQKWHHLSISVNQNVSAFSNSLSSASGADANPRDVQKGKNFTVSYLVDSLGLAKKLAESISRKVSFEDKSNPDSVLNLFRSYGFTDTHISSIISEYPQLLVLDADKFIAPKLQILQSRGTSNSELTDIVSKVPKILGRKGIAINRYYDFVKEIIEADKSSKFQTLCHSMPQGMQYNKIRNLSALRELGVPQRLLFPLLISYGNPLYGKEKFDAFETTSTSELTNIVSKVPKILTKRGISIIRYYDFVKEVIEPDKKSSKFQKLCHSIPQGMQDNQLRNLSVLRELGMHERLLFPLLISHGNPLYGKGRFDASLKKVVEMGFDPTTAKFILAPRVVQGWKDETIEDKMDVYKMLGFTVDDIWETFKKFPMVLGLSKKKILNNIETFMGLGFSRDQFAMIVKRFPQCIGYSSESVKKKAEFLVKKMNWPLETLVSNPVVFGYSLEKRTVPRCNVIKGLISKGLLDSECPPMSSVLAITDKVFLDRYVMNHDDKLLVTELTAIFTRDRVSVSDHLISKVKDC